LSYERSGGRDFFPVSREEVYRSVRDFERDNQIENPVIDENGSYEDKDFLYGAYDEYIGIKICDAAQMALDVGLVFHRLNPAITVRERVAVDL